MQNRDQIIHHSHKRAYRDPFGAVEAGQVIRLRIMVPPSEKFESISVRYWCAECGETVVHMQAGSVDSIQARFECSIAAPEKGCLLWYYFILEQKEKRWYYGNNPNCFGGIGELSEAPPPSYQITVYEKGTKTPEWFKNEIIYQIFPDRFYRNPSDQTFPIGKKKAVFHSDWNDAPMYYKDEKTKEVIAYDFFGGTLAGIAEKLPYLNDLGIGALYLNPIFEARSNHRYDTGDYHRIDPVLGTNEEFATLCQKAKEFGIRIMLDGVFNHTGSDSKYFNREGTYAEIGAYQSVDSPYHAWYDFKNYPREYACWWGDTTLPNVKELTPSYRDFVIHDQNSVLKNWMKFGISGWRLDVADELPSAFIQEFRSELKAENADAVLIGEVWEDASNKVSYEVGREYLCGKELDSAMNYPLRNIMIDYFLGNSSGQQVHQRLMSLYENYPIQNFYAMMNLLGSHDVPRILTVLGEMPQDEALSDSQQANQRLSPIQYETAVSRLRMAVLWQMTFPGVPSIYYGDEAGMQGLKDPHNRAAYAWGREDVLIRDWYHKMTALRKRYPALRCGQWNSVIVDDDVYGYVRRIADGKDVFGNAADDDVFLILFNREAKIRQVRVDVRDFCQDELKELVTGQTVRVRSGKVDIQLEALSGCIFRQEPQAKMQRGAGILLHPTSLPSRYGIGDLGKGAYEFVHFLVKAKQKVWQILPLNPVGYGYSPYQSPSAFAGNPMLISLGRLVAEGLLQPFEVSPPPGVNSQHIAYEKVWEFKRRCLLKAFKRFEPSDDYAVFCKKQAFWLDDYALFSALKEHFAGRAWYEWEEALLKRQPETLVYYRKELANSIDFYQFLQYTFFKQWTALRTYANRHGIKIVGDMPIFIAHDSSDVWAHQELFALHADGTAEKVAGVPPDYFSATGQLWGNPHYLWDKMSEDDYAWWRRRFEVLLEMVDCIRIDHFRGFEAYWEIDGGAETAMEGKWVKGPGAHFFSVLEKYFSKLPVIAEDLGVITDEVVDLKDAFALPGMKVLHFELAMDEAGDIRFGCEQNCVIYTGTHDNNTTVGWLRQDIDPCMRTSIGDLLDVDPADGVETCWALIRFAYASNAATAIIPLQDLLCMDGGARMNRPGTVGANWDWHLMDGKPLNEKLANALAQLVREYQR